MAKIFARGAPPIPRSQDETGAGPHVDHELKRIGTGVQTSPPAMRPYTPASLADGRTRTGAPKFDQLIQRDGQPVYVVQNYRRAGKDFVSWTAAGPARQNLWSERGHTITPRYGHTRSRHLQNPNDPRVGLHSVTPMGAGTVDRYLDPASGVKQTGRRQGRLMSARYRGQSYSQTTKVQGAR